jgi:dynactin 1
MGSVEMIEQLTEQNLDLETKIEEMRETIADLEEMNEVNEQIQESARDEERELRQNLDLKENRIREVMR